jgi:hypothetical protein
MCRHMLKLHFCFVIYIIELNLVDEGGRGMVAGCFDQREGMGLLL